MSDQIDTRKGRSKPQIVPRRKTLSAGGWDHSRFLDTLRGKSVVVNIRDEAGNEVPSYRGILENHDKFTVLINTQSGRVLIYKAAIEAIYQRDLPAGQAA